MYYEAAFNFPGAICINGIYYYCLSFWNQEILDFSGTFIYYIACYFMELANLI